MEQIRVTLGDAVLVAEAGAKGFAPTHRLQDTAHFHIDYEIHIQLCGQALIEIEGKDVWLKEGDACLLAPHVSHSPKSGSGTPERIVFCFSLVRSTAVPSGVRPFSEYAHYARILQGINGYCLVRAPDLIALAQRLSAEQDSPQTEHIYSPLLALFFIDLGRHIQDMRLQEAGTAQGEPVSESTLRQQKTVEEFFQTRYSDSVHIEDLARALCLSVPQTHRVVKRIFKEGFQKTLTKQRMEHACMLIRQHAVPLSEIAFLCGYTSYNGFLAAFKAHTNKTPKQYQGSCQW